MKHIFDGFIRINDNLKVFHNSEHAAGCCRSEYIQIKSFAAHCELDRRDAWMSRNV